jgi:hypothetical protein
MSEIREVTHSLDQVRIQDNISIQWENLRWQLQQEIKDLLSGQKEEDTLQKKKKSYNEVMDALQALGRGPQVDPLKTLPGEIITAIILDITSSKEQWYTSKEIGSLVPLMMVSKTWRNFIISEPLLWNFIVIDDKRTLETIISQLELSVDIPLTIKFEIPFGQWRSICQELSKHRDRIQTVIFKDPMLKKGIEFPEIAEALSPLPNLRQLGDSWGPTYDTYLYEIKTFLELFPSLKEIYNIPFRSSDLEIAKDRLILEEVQTYDSPNVFVPTVETIQGIRKVTLLTIFGGPDKRENDLESALESSRQLGWTHFKYNRYSISFPLPLLRRLLSLTSLYLGAELDTIKKVASIIHQFSQLRFFEAFISLSHGDDLSYPPVSFPNLQVHTIKILISPPDNYDEPDNPQERERLLSECHKIPEMILQTMPNAGYLKVSIIGGQSSFPFFSLKDSFKGDEMFIYFSECTPLASSDMELPSSVETLSIDCTWRAICGLSSLSLKHLNILQDFGEDPVDKNMDNLYSPVVSLEQQIDLKTWPSLETISLYKNWVQWGQSSLDSLKTVTIWEPDDNDVVDNATYFVREIARRPESYPSLEEIHLGVCPEWDILFIMLERRNLLASQGVTRIKTLWLPSSLPDSIYQGIGEIMRCKWPERPSNRELSLAGNAKTILDPQV